MRSLTLSTMIVVLCVPSVTFAATANVEFRTVLDAAPRLNLLGENERALPNFHLSESGSKPSPTTRGVRIETNDYSSDIKISLVESPKIEHVEDPSVVIPLRVTFDGKLLSKEGSVISANRIRAPSSGLTVFPMEIGPENDMEWRAGRYAGHVVLRLTHTVGKF